jgi:hypothetical protein
MRVRGLPLVSYLPPIRRTWWRTSASRQDIPSEGSQKMTLKVLFAALTVAVMLAPAARAEPAPENSSQNPVVRPVFNQPTNVPGKSLQAVTRQLSARS